jgi:osmotically-inducible protein OsmY
VAAAFRRGFRQLGRLARRTSAETYGVAQKVAHLKPEDRPVPDDATLAQKVQTEIFRDPEVPKGRINVNVENGIVVLRGELERAEQIRELVEETRKIPGVRGVENLLHLGDTPPLAG